MSWWDDLTYSTFLVKGLGRPQLSPEVSKPPSDLHAFAGCGLHRQCAISSLLQRAHPMGAVEIEIWHRDSKRFSASPYQLQKTR
eukprot:8000130-Pyramimonas_sp.AAC.1